MLHNALWLLAAVACCSCLPQTTFACQVCCRGQLSFGSFMVRAQAEAFPFPGPSLTSQHRPLQQHPITNVATIVVLRREALSHQMRRSVLLTKQEKISKSKKNANVGIDEENAPNVDSDEDAERSAADPTSALMIGTIGFYKRVISPLLPPACRFVPTCSQYGVQAIEKYGPAKGCILIAWRLLRCSPIGGKGYDPPVWPPVPFQYSSY